ncbi:M56 family metallopeptidase [Bacteroides sp.]|uniref:M56 family metallopeptidase n=1 Tax=Bacteroides sp. TaxID=29523 RepID=UPI0026086D81|nr:M56 family metallopeptidase [Bacteroides sp.]
MGTFLFYIFEVSLCLILFYFLFRMFFKADTLFRANRFLLLIGTLGCVWLPIVQLDIPHIESWQQPISTVRSLLVEKEISGNESVQVTGEKIISEASKASEAEVANQSQSMKVPSDKYLSTISWNTVIGVLYLIGAGVVLFFLLLSTWRMFRLIRHYPGCEYRGFHLVVYPGKIVSFSWGNTIVLSQEDYEKHAQEILLHEQMHLHYRHTLDLLWMEILLVFQWFNPAVWLLMRDLREIHEYEADNGVLTHGIDATQYQLLLVKKSVGTRLYSMANGFNHSKLKNRINMMLKKRTSNWARLKLLLFVPVAAGTMYAFAQPEVRKTVEQVVIPQSLEQDSLCEDDNWELLEQFFVRKRKDAFGENEPKTVKEKDIHYFFVNMNNKIMLDNEFAKNEGETMNFLRSRLTDILRKDYEQAVQNKLPFRAQLVVRYDRGTQAGAMKEYLTTIKEVYLHLRNEVATKMGGASEEQLDKILPILVTCGDPKTFGRQVLSQAGGTEYTTPLPIEIQLSNSSGNLPKTLKNISLNDLEKEIIAYKASAVGGIHVSFKTKPEMQTGMVQDVKEVIRKAYNKK